MGFPVSTQRFSLVLTGNPMDFLETKRADRHAFEYHLNHCHMEKGRSKTHPKLLPAALFQQIVEMFANFGSYFCRNRIRKRGDIWKIVTLYPIFLDIQARQHQ